MSSMLMIISNKKWLQKKNRNIRNNRVNNRTKNKDKETVNTSNTNNTESNSRNFYKLSLQTTISSPRLLQRS